MATGVKAIQELAHPTCYGVLFLSEIFICVRPCSGYVHARCSLFLKFSFLWKVWGAEASHASIAVREAI
jgi:hypothetical protein